MVLTPHPVTLALVNDFPVVTAGMRALLEPFGDGVRVASYVGQLPRLGDADVILFDPFGHPDRERRMQQIRESAHTKVIVLGTSDEVEEGLAAMAHGAVAYLPKSAGADEIVELVEAIHHGEPIEPTALAPTIAFTTAPLTGDEVARTMTSWPGQEYGLSPRESEVIVLIVDGLGNDAIGVAIYLSINSVKTYIRTAYRKMGVTSRAQAILWGIDHGMRRPPQDHPYGELHR